MKGLLYKEWATLTSSYKQTVVFYRIPLRRHQHSDWADRDGLCIARCIFHSDHLHDFV